MKTTTVATTSVILDAHLQPHIGELALAELTTERVESLYRHLAESGGRRGRPLSAATVRRAHNVLHRALAQAVEWGWLKANPASPASLPEVPAREPSSITPSVLRHLLAHAQEDDERLGLSIRLAAFTGARRAQLLALQWCDVDVSSGTVRVLDPTKRAGSYSSDKRQLSLDALTLDMLKAHKSRAVSAAEACGVRLSEVAFVFSDTADAFVGWTPASLTQAFARLAERAGVPEVRLDDLRLFAPAHLLAAGADARSVAARLWPGSNWPKHLRTDPTPEVDREAADLLARLLEAGPEEPTVGALR